MRIISAVCTAILLSGSLCAPALAEQTPAASKVALPDAKPPETRQQRLDRLFADLKRERNEKAAERIVNQIWQQWGDSGSASIDLMMQWSQKAIEQQKFDVALDFLDQVTTLQPGYAEGWNRRATVHYLMKNYAKSMADIERTLRL